jgi:thiamine biosynthesis lipoprotein
VKAIRRARPLLGTLAEVGVAGANAAPAATTMEAIDAAFAEIARIEGVLSRFEATSDIGRFNAAPSATTLDVSADTAAVLRCAAALQAESDGAFDVSIGTAPHGWSLEGRRLAKHDAAARLDLGGIGKGYAVDRAVAVLKAKGCTDGWVNAGGDLRAFGTVEVPLLLRDEESGGVRRFGALADGAFATSRYGPGTRDALAGARAPAARVGTSEPDDKARTDTRHVSIAAPTCMLADALAKVVALCGDAADPILARHGARAFVHAPRDLDADAVAGSQRP